MHQLKADITIATEVLLGYWRFKKSDDKLAVPGTWAVQSSPEQTKEK